MKVIEHRKVSKKRFGRILIMNHDLMPLERATIYNLASFGFDIEVLRPSNTPKSYNADIMMLGCLWEIKSPTTNNRSTIKKKFKKAIKQANGRAIFDLRNLKTEADVVAVEKYILTLFRDKAGMRRIMIMKNDEKLLDIIK